MRIRRIMSTMLIGMVGTIIALIIEKNKWKKMTIAEKKVANKHLNMFRVMNNWVRKNKSKRRLSDYLLNKGYKNIAIYGIGEIGETLIEELNSSGIEIKYGIDQNAREMYSELELYMPDDDLEDVDVIIVTAISAFDSIKEKLATKVVCPILPIDEIIEEM